MAQTDQTIPFWDGPIDLALDAPLGYQGPLYAQSPWDTMTIGHVQIPGVVEVRATPSKASDKKKAAGQHGEKPTMLGYKPADILIRVRLWTPLQWFVWIPILQQLWPRPGRDAPPSSVALPQPITGAPGKTTNPTKLAFDVNHPELGALGIRALYILGVMTSEKGSVTGEKIFTLKCSEWLGPVTGKPATSSVAASEPITPLLNPTDATPTLTAQTAALAKPTSAEGYSSKKVAPSLDTTVSGP